jgi:alpha-glucosidase
MYVPKGSWYDFWTSELVEGGKEKWVAAELNMLPIFVKAGAIIPKYPVQQYVDEKKIDELLLEVYYKKGTEASEIYEDANNGYDYKKGRYALSNYKLTGKEKSLTIQLFKDGSFETQYDTIRLNFHGLPFVIGTVMLDNEEVPLRNLAEIKDNVLRIDKNFTLLHLTGKE